MNRQLALKNVLAMVGTVFLALAYSYGNLHMRRDSSAPAVRPSQSLDKFF